MTPAANASPTTITTTMDSPIGDLTLTAVGGSLTGIHMNEQRHTPKMPATCVRDDAGLAHVVEQLRAYFAGELIDFKLPVSMRGTEFQRRVWAGLCDIPYGETISYGELARRVGNPKASSTTRASSPTCAANTGIGQWVVIGSGRSTRCRTPCSSRVNRRMEAKPP